MHGQELIRNFNKPMLLISDLLPFVGSKKKIKIADIGSGLITRVGTILPGVKITVYPSDKQDWTPYLAIRKQKQLIPVERQDMEKLTYPDEFFDIVYCHNALDHTRHAKEAVKEMIRVCKTDGWVVIICSLNQLDTGYTHYWNAKQDGIFDNYKEKFDLKEFGFKIQFKDELLTATLNKI